MGKIQIQGNHLDDGSVGISIMQDLQELFLRYRPLLDNVGDDKALQDRLYISNTITGCLVIVVAAR